MTTASAGDVVWFTGNSSVALSTDAGRNFTRFNPSKVLPDNGLAFCCDQVVSYAPSTNQFVWVMQYWCNKSCLVSNGATPPKNVCRTDGVFNRIRVAVATPDGLRANASNPGAAWTYWDITPSSIGQPSNAWFDRSDLSVNGVNMNLTVDTLCGNRGQASMLGRISLADLSHGGTVTLNYIADAPQRMAAAQGPGTTTYFTGNNTGSQARIWSWDQFSGTLFRHDINHSSVPVYDNATSGSDAGNWYDRYPIFPGAVESSTLSGSTLYLAQGTGRAYCIDTPEICRSDKPKKLKHIFDQPATFVTKYKVGAWSNVGERWLWNHDYALGWAALQTNDAGEVGIALRAGTAGTNVQPIAGFLNPDEQFVLALPPGLPHESGDYYSLRPGRTPRSFVMTAQTVQKDSGSPTMHWNFIEYGHGPPPLEFRQPTSITANCPGSTAPGQPATVTGKLMRSPLGGQVTVDFKSPSGGTQSVTTSADTSGNYAASITPSEPGQWQVIARYAGDSTFLDSSARCGFTVRVPQPGKTGSTMSINCPSAATQYQSFSVDGAVDPPHPGAPAQVTWTPPPGSANPPFVDQVTLDGSSHYYNSRRLNEPGTWTVQAYWPGDADHTDAYSPACQFDVITQLR